MRNNGFRSAMLGAMAFVYAALDAAAKKAQAAQMRALTKRAPTAADASVSRNGGGFGGNRAHQRAAQKRRNVVRNRLAHRG